MARGRPRTGMAGQAPANDEVSTGAAPAVNGNGPAKAYRHKGEKGATFHRQRLPEGRVPAAPSSSTATAPGSIPILRFDSGSPGISFPELLEKVRHEPLTETEARVLAEALRQPPSPGWNGPANASCRPSPSIRWRCTSTSGSARRPSSRWRAQDVERSLFADPELEYHEAVQFYRHDIDWSNRLILGDSLQVMAPCRREDLAGKVQMIYIDPPYGIKFASNFQPEVGKRDVKDKETDLTREPEMVKAYRDTWNLGTHSYLTYLRDRLLVAKDSRAQCKLSLFRSATKTSTAFGVCSTKCLGHEIRRSDHP